MQYLGAIDEGVGPRSLHEFATDEVPHAIYARFLRPLPGMITQLTTVYCADHVADGGFFPPWSGGSSLTLVDDGAAMSLCGGVSQQGGVALWWVR